MPGNSNGSKFESNFFVVSILVFGLISKKREIRPPSKYLNIVGRI
jgi:hypothetical protein